MLADLQVTPHTRLRGAMPCEGPTKNEGHRAANFTDGSNLTSKLRQKKQNVLKNSKRADKQNKIGTEMDYKTTGLTNTVPRQTAKDDHKGHLSTDPPHRRVRHQYATEQTETKTTKSRTNEAETIRQNQTE